MIYPNEPAGFETISGREFEDRPVVSLERRVANAMRYWAAHIVPVTDDVALFAIWRKSTCAAPGQLLGAA